MGPLEFVQDVVFWKNGIERQGKILTNHLIGVIGPNRENVDIGTILQFRFIADLDGIWIVGHGADQTKTIGQRRSGRHVVDRGLKGQGIGGAFQGIRIRRLIAG